MPNIVGGCLCGSVRYESEAEPVLTAACHCHHCQKQTSSAFSIFVVLPKGSLRMEGEALAAFEDVGDSGLPVFRKFCTKCGSAIVSEPITVLGRPWPPMGQHHRSQEASLSKRWRQRSQRSSQKNSLWGWVSH